MMMRNIAIGLAAATIAIGGSTLNASALYGQESGISKGSMSRTPLQRERLRGIVRERFAELTPLQRERLKGIVRERFAELTPLQRERLKGIVGERFAELTPLQRERLKEIVRERFAELTPLQRERLSRFVLRERLYRHGPYGAR
jgi:Protein of unknown function (DUF3106)